MAQLLISTVKSDGDEGVKQGEVDGNGGSEKGKINLLGVCKL